MLTALGMVIGTASVILVVTISLTSQTYILDQIEGVGSNMIFASYEIGTQSSSAEVSADYIKSSDVQAVREQERLTKEKEMAIVQVAQVRQAEIDKDVNTVKAMQQKEVSIVAAEGNKQSNILTAEGNLEAKKRKSLRVSCA